MAKENNKFRQTDNGKTNLLFHALLIFLFVVRFVFLHFCVMLYVLLSTPYDGVRNDGLNN